MADEANEAQEATPETGNEPETTPEAQAEDTPQETPAEEPANPESVEDDFDKLPDWAQKEVKKLRQEAAARRIENNELRDKVAEATSGEEALALVKELQDKLALAERQRTVAELARTHNLPEAAAVLLTAETPEALEAQAAAIASLTGGQGPATPPPLTPSGGRDPMGAPVDDVQSLLAKANARRR